LACALDLAHDLAHDLALRLAVHLSDSWGARSDQKRMSATNEELARHFASALGCPVSHMIPTADTMGRAITRWRDRDVEQIAVAAATWAERELTFTQRNALLAKLWRRALSDIDWSREGADLCADTLVHSAILRARRAGTPPPNGGIKLVRERPEPGP